MQESRTVSTLELIVDDQQSQTMSQIDLSRPIDANQSSPDRMQQQQQPALQPSGSDTFNLNRIRALPASIRDGFNTKLDEAKSKSNSKTEYVFEIIQAFSSVIIWTLCLICTTILPFLLLLIGIFNLNECADQPALPYLVFSFGFVMTASNLFNLALALDIPILTNHRILSIETKNTIASILNIIFNCVVTFLYILTSYMVYTIGSHRKSSNPDDQGSPSPEETDDGNVEDTPNCNGLLYSSSFWFMTLTLSLFFILTLVAAVLFAYNRYRLAIIRGSTPRSQNNTTNNSTGNLSSSHNF